MILQPGTYRFEYTLNVSSPFASRVNHSTWRRELLTAIPARTGNSAQLTNGERNPLTETVSRLFGRPHLTGTLVVGVTSVTDSRAIDTAYYTALSHSGVPTISVAGIVRATPDNGSDGFVTQLTGDITLTKRSIVSVPSGTAASPVQGSLLDRLMASRTSDSSSPERVGVSAPRVLDPTTSGIFDIPTPWLIAGSAIGAIALIGVIGYTVRAFK